MLNASSVDQLLSRIQQLTTRPVPEFNRYDALALVESLKNTAHDTHHEKAGYYRLTFETLRGKMDETDERFRNFLLPLLGDKDQERILDIVSKVEKKHQGVKDTASSSRRTPYVPYRNLRCFYCNRFGHFQARCPQRRLDGTTQQYLNSRPARPAANRR